MRRNNIERQQHRDGARLNRRYRRAVAVLTAAALVLAGITSGVYGVSVRATETTSSELQSSSDIYIEDASAAASAASVSSDGGADSSSSDSNTDISNTNTDTVSDTETADTAAAAAAAFDTSDSDSSDTSASDSSDADTESADTSADSSSDASDSDASEEAESDTASGEEDGEESEDEDDEDEEEDEESEDEEDEDLEDEEELDEELEDDELEEDDLEDEELEDEEDEEDPAEEIELDGVTDSTTGLTVSVSGSRAALNGAETIRVSSVDSDTADSYENLLNEAVGASDSEDGSEEDEDDDDSDDGGDADDGVAAVRQNGRGTSGSDGADDEESTSGTGGGDDTGEDSDADGESGTQTTSYTFHAVLNIELLDENNEVVQPAGAVTVTLSGDAIKTWRAEDGTFGVMHIVTEESSTGSDSGNDSGDADSAEDADEEDSEGDLSSILTAAEVGESIEADGVTFVAMIVETLSSTSVSFETDSFSPYPVASKVAAAAEGDDDSVVRYTTDTGAADSIGTDNEENLNWTYEDSLQDAADAIADAAGTGVIQLLCDIDCDADDASMDSGNSGTDSDDSYNGYRDITLPSGTDITLDLNGCTITGSGIGSVLVVEGSLTLMDSTAEEPTAESTSSPSDEYPEPLSADNASDYGEYYFYNNTTYYGNFPVNWVTQTPTSTEGEGVTSTYGTKTTYTSTYTGCSLTLDEDGSYSGSYTLVTYSYTAGAITGGSNSSNLWTGYGIDTDSYDFVGGGIVLCGDASFAMLSGIICGNTAWDGGGIYAYEGCTITMSGGAVANNSAAGQYGNNHGNGGGICASNNCKVILSGGAIAGNYALAWSNDGSGGGLYAMNTDVTVKGDIVITGNDGYLGGGICAIADFDTKDDEYYPVLELAENSSVMICCNYSRMYGGGLYGHYVSIKINGGNICANYASRGGGGIYSGAGPEEAATLYEKLDISGGIICGNIAASTYDDGRGYGAGVCTSACQFTMSGGDIVGNIASMHGGGVMLRGSDTFTMTGGRISYNAATGIDYESGGETACYGSSAWCGGLLVEGSDKNEISFTLNGGEISHNTSDNQAGGIYATGVNCTITIMSGSVVSYNEAGTYGGGICCYFLEKFTMSGGSFSNNIALAGSEDSSDSGNSDESSVPYGAYGGIYLYQCTEVVFSGGEISNNCAEDGAAGGVYISECGSATFKDTTVKNNEASDLGGGIDVYHTPLTMVNCVVSNNFSTDDAGGGLCFYGDDGGNEDKYELKITDSTFEGNYSGTYGGAIFLSYACKATISGCTISGNEAKTYAGGIHLNSLNTKTVYLTGDSVVSDNTAGDSGGGIFVNTGAILYIKESNITENSAAYKGGGVYSLYGTVTLVSGTVTSNEVTDDTYINYGGGGIYNQSGTVTVEGGTISSNTATRYGGGINNCGGTITIKGGEISGNEADYYGGGIYNLGYPAAATVTIEDGTISGNTASYGGGIFNYYYSYTPTITMDGGTISSNTAYCGGGIYNYGTLNISDGSIESNTASYYGGGICNYRVIAISGGNISGNSAQYGGGIINWSTLTISDGTISSNTATYSGGGLYHGSGTATFSGGSFTSNSARYGGGIYNYSTLTISDGSVESNTATYGGGGIYGSYGTVTISNGSISSNSAEYGGGILNSATLTVPGGTISSNSATYGGGLYNTSAATLSGGDFFENYASDEGGGVNQESGTLELAGSSLYGNSTDGNGGGIYVESGTVSMTGGTIGGLSSATSLPSSLGNTAVNGAGVYLNGGTMTMSGGTITGNAAGNYGSDGILSVGSTNSTGTGGGVYVASGTFTMQTTTSTGTDEDGNETTSVTSFPILANNTAGLAAADLYSAASDSDSSVSTSVTLVDWGGSGASEVTYLFDGEGYSIGGWYKDPDKTGTRYADQEMDGHTEVKDAETDENGNEISGTGITQNTTGLSVVAAWARYYLLYYANYTGNRSYNETLHVYADDITIAKYADLFSESRKGYTFVGWNTEKDGTGTWYYPSSLTSGNTVNGSVYESFVLYASTYLYAQWLQDAPTGIEADTAPYVWMVMLALAGAAGLIFLQLQRRRRWE